MLGVLPPSVMSVAVAVALPLVFSVRLKVLVPPTSALVGGKLALGSLELIPALAVTELTRFQFASTALTVTLKAVPAVRAVGVPLLPLTLPGAAASPGTKNCNLVNAVALTEIAGLVLAVLLTSLRSVAVTVELPAAFKVTLKLWTPLMCAACGGRPVLLSDDLIPSVSVSLLIEFQL